jgi:hypothetical protein
MQASVGEYEHLPALTQRERLIFQIGFGQALAQPIERAKSKKPIWDQRVFQCPGCGCFGMNTMWGVVQYECGAEMCGDVFDECRWSAPKLHEAEGPPDQPEAQRRPGKAQSIKSRPTQRQSHKQSRGKKLAGKRR